MTNQTNLKLLKKLAGLIRYYILSSTTEAGSGHPTSALSAVELMTGLFFGGIFKYNMDRPDHPNNDRLIFSKGHASPLFYALWAATGAIDFSELLTLRKFGSRLQGHPNVRFPYTEAATGSLGQGLSIGAGMALNAKYLDQLPYRTYVLLGDGEMAEGSIWESVQIAAHYGLNNLTGIIDVNRLGQSGETLYGHDLSAFEKRVSSFGWKTMLIDGHDFEQVMNAFNSASLEKEKPFMIIAKTIKAKGVSFAEDKNGWHGKALNREELAKALNELGPLDQSIRGKPAEPQPIKPVLVPSIMAGTPNYPSGKPVTTRKAYGNALARICNEFPGIVVLDSEVKNSTFSQIFEASHPDRFFEMYIAEQNMVGCAIGLSARGKIPFVSSFAAFLTRAFDQIRMSSYSRSNIKFAGTHTGVSTGPDGPSQMGLEDIAMFRTVLDSVILYPSDAVSTERLVEQAARHRGIVYIRLTRVETPIIYNNTEEFPIGGCKVLRRSAHDTATVVAAGITVHETLAAYESLKKESVFIRVIDLYSIKPLDHSALLEAAKETGTIITVEDHYAEGGLGEAVLSALAGIAVKVCNLAVKKMPVSGTPSELLDFEEISGNAIIKKVKEVLQTS